MVDFSKHVKQTKTEHPEPTPQTESETVGMVQRIFRGRIMDVNNQGQEELPASARRRTANEANNVPVEKMFRCQGENPGCGLPKPANAFYKEIKEICSECALKLARKHQIDLYWVPLAINCYSITRQLAAEAKRLATPEGQQKGFSSLVVDHGIDEGRNHFVKCMIEGTRTSPLEHSWVIQLHERYRTWFFNHYDIPKEKYSNLPKNDLLV